MGKANKWTSMGYVDRQEWEAKIPPNGRYILARPVGQYNSDDPHIRVDLDNNGEPIWSTFHSNFNGYFGTREVIVTAITVFLGM
jgi:hypothetical protein